MNKTATILILVLLLLFSPLLLMSQAPEKISYQAVIRDAENNLVSNQPIGIQISILDLYTDGPPLYIERHFPNTNDNGLVSIEIGDGLVIDGDFTSIDWANSHYYLQIETDLNGGASYTISGITQVLSVPYAFHATTADSITGVIQENDPIFNLSQSANITATDITNLSNLSGLNTGDQDLSELATLSALEDTALAIRNDLPNVIKYSVGDFAQGGIVFWVDETGQHGLVCTLNDLDSGSGIEWYNSSNIYTEALGDGTYSGEMNTMLIIVVQGNSSNTYAAGLCANFVETFNDDSYGDWYLPSKEELNLMYLNKSVIDATATANGGTAITEAPYWSSTEINAGGAWGQYFGVGGNQVAYAKFITNKVRAIRAF